MPNSFEEFWHYHSESPTDRAPEPPQPLALAIDDTKGALFEISVATTRLRPNHQLTLLTEATGWSREILGSYWSGVWYFKLLESAFANGTLFRFKLDGEVLSQEFELTAPSNLRLEESDLKFPCYPKRFLHGYENLRVSDDRQQQIVCPSAALESVDWDVIIIGSGMGGGTLADALSDHSGKRPKVLVLEAGSLEYDTHTNNKPLASFGRSVDDHEVPNYRRADSQTEFRRYPHMNLGGRSMFWSGLIPRMQEWELTHWPEPVADYLRKGGYEAAETLMRKHVTGGEYQERVMKDLAKRFETFEVVDTPRSLHQPEFSEPGGAQPPSFLFRSTGTYSSAELLLDSLQSPGPGRLAVQCNHLVTKLVTEEDKTTKTSRVTKVICEDLAGNRTREFHGKFVVLAAGSLESPRLAMVSQLEPARLIGTGLTDHPSYFAPQDGSFLLKESSPYAGRSNHAKMFFYPKQPWQGHWFNVEIVINGEYWNSRHADDDVIRNSHPSTGRSFINFKFIFGSPLMNGNWVQLGGDDGKLRVHVPRNPTGGDDKTREAVKELFLHLMDFFEVEPVKPDNFNLHFGDTGTINHAGGTLRMGRPNEDRVVDENLKFVTCQNLYVCDPSVYPYIPAANPSLTLVALAQRLGEHLASLL